MDPNPAIAAANAAAAASVQALVEALQLGPHSSAQKLTLASFWREDPIGWFHYAESEFVIAGLPANGFLCYNHVLRALPPDVIATVRDLVRSIQPDTPHAYELLKQALLTRYTSSALEKCFKLLDHPPIGDRHPLTLYADMQALLPQDANILFNALYLRRLPDSWQHSLAGRGELPPHELAAAAATLPRQSTAVAAAATQPAHLSAPLPPSPPPLAAAAFMPGRRQSSRSPARFRRAATPRRQPSPKRPLPGRQKSPLRQPPPDARVCFYHYNFGRRARRCESPCSFIPEN